MPLRNGLIQRIILLVLMNPPHGPNMKLDTRDLRLVAAIAEHGGVTRASQHLYLTQSAVSHQLLGLEKRLGTPLFHRLGKRLVPTAAGAKLIAGAEQLLRDLQQLEQEAMHAAAGRSLALRISTECYTCYHWLPRVMEEYQRDFPNVDVSIVAEVTQHPIPALLEGRIDLAIVHAPNDDERVTYMKLFDDELVAIMPESHPLARRAFLTPADFADQHLITYSLPLTENSFYQEVLSAAAVKPRKITQIQLTEGIVEMVRAGVGIAVFANWAVSGYLERGRLTAVPVTEQRIKRRWRAAVLKQSATPHHLKKFVQLLAAETRRRQKSGELVRVPA
jgi:LysR family transcriptional regulator for metE and metH